MCAQRSFRCRYLVTLSGPCSRPVYRGRLEMLSTREAELATFPTRFIGTRALFCVERPWSAFPLPYALSR